MLVGQRNGSEEQVELATLGGRGRPQCLCWGQGKAIVASNTAYDVVRDSRAWELRGHVECPLETTWSPDLGSAQSSGGNCMGKLRRMTPCIQLAT